MLIRGTANHGVIKAGNAAAHEADFLADSNLFALGFMSGPTFSELQRNFPKRSAITITPPFPRTFMVVTGLGTSNG
jgi:hypothetical protein